MAVMIHENVTIANPSRFVRVRLFLENNHTGNPTLMHTKAETKNPFKSDSPYPRDIKIGTTIVMPKIERRAPSIFRRVLSFMM
jgi:hypothetical protein